MYQAETIPAWDRAAARLHELDARLYIHQYDAALPEGFRATFYVPGGDDITIITHSAAVMAAIRKYQIRKPPED